ncbi:MAG: acyl-ACP--UDP-N-acetylglucosamine O-acyltransferase [Puniceicoccaceae bacterium]
MPNHPTAVIHEATRIPDDVTIGAYAVVEDGVEIGSGSIIREHAIIRSGTILGQRCIVDAHAVIGGLPQDFSFNPATPSGVRIGDNVTIREGVTINRATFEGQFTEVGDGCMLMANSHLGHDCKVGRNVILANNVMLAGKVSVGEFTFIGGGAGIHQFCRIGQSAMVSGLSRVSQDIPPFCMMAERNELIGLNLVGLRRRGIEREAIKELKKLYHLVYSVEGRPKVLAEGALKDDLAKSDIGRQFLEFMTGESSKGVMRPRKEGQ